MSAPDERVGDASSPEDETYFFVGDLLLDLFARQDVDERQDSPRLVSVASHEERSRITSASPKITLFDLRTAKQWRAFHTKFTEGRQVQYLNPWRRCISVLRGLGAKSAVVEHHYVCMDWRSELSAYYSSLDAPRSNFTKRIHFFSATLKEADIQRLTDRKKSSYLGYIVIRDRDLPMVGRSVIALPAYLRESDFLTTAVDEPVHFLGQDLSVRGIPFMQQDSRFAVCAHIVAWIAHYTAFRRGVAERRFIADFVARPAPASSMHPGRREGLSIPQVTELLERFGLRSHIYDTLSVTTSLPEVDPIAFGSLVTTIAKHLPTIATSEVESLTEAVESELLRSQPRTGPIVPISNASSALRAYEELLSHFVRPYIESGFPGYLGTRDHAYALCAVGVSGRGGYFVHDDQNGPYLYIDSLLAISPEDLKYQSGGTKTPGSTYLTAYPPRDRVARRLDSSEVSRPIDMYIEDGTQTFIMTAPRRAVLPCHAAYADACTSILDFEDVSMLAGDVSKGLLAALASDGRRRCTLLMGIDYKQLRRKIRGVRDPMRVAAYSSTHLAEWVVVVEGINSKGAVEWEFVFDATSSPTWPRLQCARIGSSFMAIDPLRPNIYYSVQLAGTAVPQLELPQRVGKTFR